MVLELARESQGTNKIVHEDLSSASIMSFVRSLDWSVFTFLTLKADSQNWIEISGNLGDDGLAIVIEQNGLQKVSERSPESVTDVENVLIDYFNGRFDLINSYFVPQAGLDYQYSHWKAAQPTHRIRRISIKLISVAIAVTIMGTVFYGLYLWTSHEFKFLGHETAHTSATVVETKYRPYFKSMVQIVKYEFQIDQKLYYGYFRASTTKVRKHYIGDRVKVKFAVDDPSISKRLATYKR